MYHYTDCGLEGIKLQNGYEEIEIDGEVSVSISAIDSLHAAIASNLCQLPRHLDGREIRFLRIELDMSQKALGDLIGKSEQCVAKWEKGQNSMPRADEVVLRWLYLESRDETSKLRELLCRLNEIDRDIQELERGIHAITFAVENDDHWVRTG